MFRRRILWIVLMLLCLCGVWSLWRRDNRQPSQAAGAGTTAAISATNPASSTRAGSAPAKSRAREDHLAKYRLSNTTMGYNDLLHRDSALVLENARWDTTQPLELDIPAHLRAQGDPGAYLVKSRGPVTEEFRARLRGAGATMISYMPHDAWLVRASKSQVAALSDQPGVQAVLPFEPYYKLKSVLLPLAVGQQPMLPGTRLNLLLFADGRAEALRALGELGANITGEAQSPFGPVVTIQAPLDSLPALAQLNGVCLIERAAMRAPVNDRSRVKMGVSTSSLQTNTYFGLTGTNVVVAMADSGVDMTHPDLVGRVYTNSPLSGVDTNGHGTHVAAIIAGDGTASATVTTTPRGSVTGANFAGKAPAAKLFSMVLDETPAGAGFNFDTYAQEQIAKTNALIANMSFGSVGVYDYDLGAASYDASVRDGQPQVPGSRPILFVFSAGNDGGADDDGLGGVADSIQSPGTSKNSITVGNLEQFRDITNKAVVFGVTNAVWQGETDSDIEVMRKSARGNVGPGVEGEFGRFKPDVVAPGTFVISARSAQWDQGEYYSTTNKVKDTFEGRTNGFGMIQYTMFIPSDTVGLTISVASQDTNQPNLEIYVRSDHAPTTNDPPYINTVSIPPALGTLAPVSTFYYAIRNPYSNSVRFTVTTELSITNELEDYYRVLKQELNDPLGPFYRYETGTSMAAPAVSGVLALMQEFYEQRMLRTNSPALMKAMLINGARSSSSIYKMRVRNTVNHQGWGFASLPTSLPSSTNVSGTNASFLFFDQSPTNALATGRSQTRLVALGTNSQSAALRFTLVWTDPPGNPVAGIKLVNDLDLVVTNRDTGEVYFGNDIAESDFNSVWNTNTVPNADMINNVENVYIKEPLGTNFSVTVTGRRVNVNAVTAHTNDIVQDYALVISSGDGEVTNAFTVAELPVTYDETWNITHISNSVTAGPLLNQSVGANAPILAGLNGITNQWHFYVTTNYGTNASFTNAAFLTFLPPTLSTPRMGVRSGADDEHSRPEGDIDMYVSTNPALTNLNAGAVAAAIRSVGRGGTETVVLSNSAPGLVYYIGIKSEDQMAGQYGFFSVFSDVPFSSKDAEGNLYLRGIPTPALIPDGTAANPGTALIFGIAVEQVKVRRVIVTNILTHDNFGDLVGNLSHNNRFAVLHNHTFGTGLPTQLTAYDDSGQGDIIGSKTSDGPGSLRSFVGEEGIGQWLLTMLDNVSGATGRVDQLIIKIEPQKLQEGGDLLTIQPNSWAFDFIEVPAGATNLTINLVNISATPLPVDLYIRYNDFPDFINFDKKTTINPPGGSLTLTPSDFPPLQPGIYIIGVFNPNGIAQTVRLTATIGIDLNGIVPVVYASTNRVPLIDDAVTMDGIFVTNNQRIVSVEVGLRVNHPRISDMAFQLVSPDNKRVLLFENRGGTDVNGLGSDSTVTNYTDVWLGSFEGPPNTNWLATVGNYFGEGWLVNAGDVDVLTSGTFGSAAYDGNVFIDLDGNNPGTISTNIPTIAGQSYKLSFAFSRNPDSIGFGEFPSANVLINGASAGTLNPAFINSWPNLNWQTTSFVFTATSPVTPLVFQSLGTGPRGVLLDAVKLSKEEIPLNYAYFTEDTNKSPVLLKFTPPPFVPTVAAVNLVNSGFETAAAGSYAAPAGFEGWTVADTNEVGVFADAATAQAGGQFLALADGRITRVIPTVPGRNYTLQYSYRAPGIAGWWRGESNGVDSVFGNTATLLNGLVFGAGEVGQGFLFDGVDDRAVIPASPVLNVGTGAGMTVELWMNPLQIKLGAMVEWNDDAGGIGAHFWQSVDQLAPGDGVGNLFGNIMDTAGIVHQIASPAGLLATNVYQHVALTYHKASGVAVIYLNGIAVATQNLGTFTPQTSYALHFGARTSGPFIPDRFHGTLDEVSVYSRALSPAELKAIAIRGPIGKFDPLVASPLNLAEMTAVFGTLTNVHLGNAAWQTVTTNFVAVSGSTVLEFDGLAPGMLLDSVTVTQPPQSVFLLPEETLSAFKGDNAYGLWKLEAWDSRVGATNPAPELVSWNLSFVFPNPVAPFVTVLQPGVVHSNTIPPGAFHYLIVDVPIWASVATNSLLYADLPLFWWFNQNGLPLGTNPPDALFPGSPIAAGVWNLTLTPPSVPPLQPGQRYYIGLQNTSALPVNYAYRVDFDITALTNAMPYAAITSSNGVPRYFTYTVSSNASAVLFDLFGMDGNLNLVARQGAPLPTPFSFDYGSFNPGLNDEQIIVFTNGTPVALQPGLWYLGVFNTTIAPVNYTIRATELTNAFPDIITLTNQIPYFNVNNGAPGTAQFYRYTVSATAARVQFETFGMTGDFTLVCRKGLPLPNLLGFDYRSARPGNNDELIVVLPNSAPVALAAGDWFITAVKMSPGPGSYFIMATEWATTGQPIVTTGENVGGGFFCITWASLPGVHYIVQSTTGLGLPWTNASPDILAGDVTTTWCTDIVGPMAFFRVIEGISLNGSVSGVVISSVQFTPGGIVLTWFGPPDAIFQVEWAASLATPVVWTPVGAPVTSPTGIFTFTDAPLPAAPRFYRLRMLP